MIRKNKIELRRAIEEEVQECHEEMENRFGNLRMDLFDEGLGEKDVKKIIEKERMLYSTMLRTKQIDQFYRIIK